LSLTTSVRFVLDCWRTYTCYIYIHTYIHTYSISSITARIQPGIRCTVQLDPTSYGRPGPIHGTVISPSVIAHTDGTYWGYTVRIASSIQAVWEECPYTATRYDLTIGTSERGQDCIDDVNFSLPPPLQHSGSSSSSNTPTTTCYQHALIVFGGVSGIEECIDADETIPISGANSSTLFDHWVNICPYQGSRTIRTEEAILITLAKLSPFLLPAAPTAPHKTTAPVRRRSRTTAITTATANSRTCTTTTTVTTAPMVLYDDDEQLSDESSSRDDDDDNDDNDQA
jgi:predicted SPOUT superfamily RNA methylase MTH1